MSISQVRDPPSPSPPCKLPIHHQLKLTVPPRSGAEGEIGAGLMPFKPPPAHLAAYIATYLCITYKIVKVLDVVLSKSG